MLNTTRDLCTDDSGKSLVWFVFSKVKIFDTINMMLRKGVCDGNL